MKAKDFLLRYAVKDGFVPSEDVELILDEYAQIVLGIAAEKAEIKFLAMIDASDCVEVDKESILNCLKD